MTETCSVCRTPGKSKNYCACECGRMCRPCMKDMIKHMGPTCATCRTPFRGPVAKRARLAKEVQRAAAGAEHAQHAREENKMEEIKSLILTTMVAPAVAVLVLHKFVLQVPCLALFHDLCRLLATIVDSDGALAMTTIAINTNNIAILTGALVLPLAGATEIVADGIKARRAGGVGEAGGYARGDATLQRAIEAVVLFVAGYALFAIALLFIEFNTVDMGEYAQLRSAARASM